MVRARIFGEGVLVTGVDEAAELAPLALQEQLPPFSTPANQGGVDDAAVGPPEDGKVVEARFGRDLIAVLAEDLIDVPAADPVVPVGEDPAVAVVAGVGQR